MLINKHDMSVAVCAMKDLIEVIEQNRKRIEQIPIDINMDSSAIYIYSLRESIKNFEQELERINENPSFQ